MLCFSHGAIIQTKRGQDSHRKKKAIVLLPCFIFIYFALHNAAHSLHIQWVSSANECCRAIYDSASFCSEKKNKEVKNASSTPVTISVPFSEVAPVTKGHSVSAGVFTLMMSLSP